MPDTLAPPANDALPLSSRSELRFLACGSVDDGKSTLIGRLINDATGLPEDEVASLRDDSRRFGTTDDELDFALLLDGLEAEREQGITIDVAYRFFTTPRRAFVVADTPGHQQYTRNMATGASNAELAVLLVDARKGLTEQTRRHAAIVSLLGIRHVVLAVNKIDLVEFSEARFREIEAAFTAFATPLAFHSVVPIPVSARLGDNVAIRGKRTPWYAGPTLLGHLETVETDLEAVGAPLRFPVQWVNRPDGEFRGFTGTVASGRVAVGDKLVVAGSGRASAVARIVSFDGDLPSAAAGRSVTLTLADEVDVIRGDLLADPRRRPVVTRRLAADLVWMDETPATRPSLLVRSRDPRDERAWGEFLEIYSPLVYQFARRKGFQDSDADDLAQEVFRAVAAAIDRWDADPSRGSFRGWLLRITRNQMIDFTVRNKRVVILAAIAMALNL